VSRRKRRKHWIPTTCRECGKDFTCHKTRMGDRRCAACRKRAEDEKRRKKAAALGTSTTDAMLRRLPGSFEGGKRQR
jgi:hypothetical protein